MASSRLLYINSILKHTKKLKTNNFSVTSCHANHSLCHSRLFTGINRESPKSFSNFHRYWLVFSLEHGIRPASNATFAGDNISQSSESLNSKQVVESVSGAGTSNNSDAVTENLNPFDYSVLPPIPDSSVKIIQEPTFESIGLGGWWPPGIVQQILEFFHVSFNVPWWAAIVGLTVTLRFFLFPLAIKLKKDMIDISNNMPEYHHLQNKVAEARNSGSYYEVAQCAQELSDFVQKKKMFSLSMLWPYCIQFPIFISTFIALQRMSGTPELRSFSTGGILWFTDLSVPDQYYLLPIITAATVSLLINTGIHRMNSRNPLAERVIKIVAPAIVFWVTMSFPAGTVCYWATTNIFSIFQTYLLKVEPVRKYFNIPKEIQDFSVPKIPKSALQTRGFIDSFRDSYRNLKIISEIEDRERLNAIKFEQNAQAPTRRTFSFNPKEVAHLAEKKKKK